RAGTRGVAAAARTAARIPAMAARARRDHLRRNHRDRRGRGPRVRHRTGRGAGGGRAGPTSGRGQVSDPHCWGIFRERAHSPGREYDDSEILTLTGKELEARGFQVTLKSPEEALSSPEPRPVGVFMMCERIAILQRLHAVEARGVPHVNSPRAVLNTYRDRMITQFQEANVPFVPSHFVSTVDGHGVGALPVWVKRPDVHNTQDGDVVFGDTAERVGQALPDLAARGIHPTVAAKSGRARARSSSASSVTSRPGCNPSRSTRGWPWPAARAARSPTWTATRTSISSPASAWAVSATAIRTTSRASSARSSS